MKGNLNATGYISFLGKAKYSSLTIGTPSKPFNGFPDLFIAFEDGRKFRLRDIPNHRDQLKEHIAAPEEGWPRNVESYGKEGYYFLISGGKLVEFFAAEIRLPGQKFTPVIGDLKMREMVRFPISQADLEILVGPAEQTEDKFTW